MALAPLPVELLARIYKEFNTTECRVKEEAQLVKKWLQQQPHLMNIDDDNTLECLLFGCEGSAERAKVYLESYAAIRIEMPEFFSGRDPLDQKFTKVLQIINCCTLPQATSKGEYCLMIKLCQSDTMDLKAATIYQYLQMVTDIANYKNKTKGFVFIVDFEKADLKYFMKWKYGIVKKIFRITNLNPSLMRGVHFLNSPPYLSVFMAVVKLVLRGSDMLDRVHVHKDLDSLYKLVDREILPREYGGAEKFLEELSSECKRYVDGFKEWFLKEEEFDAVHGKRSAGK